MKVLHFVENLDYRYGGPARSVPGLVHHLNDLGVQNIMFSAKVYEDEVNTLIALNNLDWRSFKILGPKKLRICPLLKKAVESEITADTIIHIQTLWSYPSYLGFRTALRYKLPLVVSTRGMLYPWALKQRRWIKKLAMFIFQRSMLKTANAIHITEPSELDGMFDTDLSDKACLIPNGIDLEEFSNLPIANDAKESFGLDLNKKYILFFSRVHPKKGLIHLVKFWIELCFEHPEWDLLICGPFEPSDVDYFETVKSIIKNAGVEDRVIWTGLLHGQARFNAFSAANLFVLPSYSENFGIVILEALSSGLPVIITTGTPWEEVVDYEAGWQIDINNNELRSALLEAFSLSKEELKLKGEKGKILAKKYCWSFQAEKMLDLYKSVSAT